MIEVIQNETFNDVLRNYYQLKKIIKMIIIKLKIT